MSSTASDTLSAVRRLKAAGIEAEQADAIVGAVDQATGQFVTVKHFDAAVERLDSRIDTTAAMLNTRIDGLEARIDGLKTYIDAAVERLDSRIDALRSELQAGIDTTRSELQASISAGQAAMARLIVIVAGVIIAANALTIGILRFFPWSGAAM